MPRPFCWFIPRHPPSPPTRRELPRARALQPGGPLTRRFLAPQNTVLTVGSTVFVHAGVLPKHAAPGTASAINEATRRWMLGRGPLPAEQVHSRSAVTWTREYSRPGQANCEALQRALAAMDMRRMVVGHTVRDGIQSECAQRVYCIDVGLSSGCGDGEPEVLEILNDKCAACRGCVAPRSRV